MNQFINLTIDDEIIEKAYKIKSKDNWNLSKIRKKLFIKGSVQDCIKDIAYRPFDDRFIAYDQDLIERGRYEVMHNMLEENIGLLTTRFQFKKKMEWTCVYISENIIDINLLQSPGTAQIMPLYKYPNKKNKDLFNHHQMEKEPNIPESVFEELASAYGIKPTPEEIIYYIYSVFFSTLYREKYAEFLKIDFPRVPFTSDYELFKAVGTLGNALADLHLLKSHELDSPVAKYQGAGENDRIEKVKYDEETGRIYINDDKYFEGIEPEVWHYHIGGYQVLYKYLKDRKGRILEDARRYCRIVTALQKTIVLQKEIDQLYPSIEENILE